MKPRTILLIASFFYIVFTCPMRASTQDLASKQYNTTELQALVQNKDIDGYIHCLKKVYRDSSLTAKERILLNTIEELEANNGDNTSIAKCYLQLGTYYRKGSKHDLALETYHKAQISNNEKTNIEVLNNLGVTHRRLSQLQSATSHHLQALKRIEQYTGDYEDVSFQHRVSLNSIGNIYLSLKQYDEALKYFNLAIELELKASNHLGIAINYGNIGACEQALENYEQARLNYEKSLAENKIIESALGQCICHNNIGELYVIEEQMDKAMERFDSAYVYSSQLGYDYYHRSITHTNLAESYLHFNQPEKAISHIRTLKEMAIETNSPSVLMSYYSNYSSYFEAIGNIDSAFHYYRKASISSENISSESAQIYINDLLSFYESEKKEQQIQLLSSLNEANSQRKRLWLALSLLLLIAFALLYYIEDNKKRKQVLEVQILQQQLLRTQMNPHFLFNALGSIQNFMLTNKIKEAAKYLNNFSSLTRSILEHSSKKEISLSEEIDTLHNYIKLEKLRLNYSFEYEIEYDDDLETDFILLPPMLIQPFVENAIKHGLKNIAYKGQLYISLTEGNNLLHICIKDNGVGYNHKQTKSSTHRSMSMDIFHKRLKYILKNEKKRINFSIQDASEISSNDQGTIVNIKLPISS